MMHLWLAIVFALLFVPRAAFTQPALSDMEWLYKNPPGAKKIRAGYILYKPSVVKLDQHIYRFTMIHGTAEVQLRLDVKIDCGSSKIAYGCGTKMDKNADRVISKTDACSTGLFEPFRPPKDADYKQVIKAFCRKYDR